MAEGYVECAFMIPLVRNSDRQPHSPLAMRDLEDSLFSIFEGLTGPERVYRIPCNTFDQESIYLSIAGKVELVFAEPEDGFLGGGR